MKRIPEAVKRELQGMCHEFDCDLRAGKKKCSCHTRQRNLALRLYYAGMRAASGPK